MGHDEKAVVSQLGGQPAKFGTKTVATLQRLNFLLLQNNRTLLQRLPNSFDHSLSYYIVHYIPLRL
jgi:hypothetical protein